jgi:hypothetical protein
VRKLTSYFSDFLEAEQPVSKPALRHLIPPKAGEAADAPSRGSWKAFNPEKSGVHGDHEPNFGS